MSLIFDNLKALEAANAGDGQAPSVARAATVGLARRAGLTPLLSHWLLVLRPVGLGMALSAVVGVGVWWALEMEVGSPPAPAQPLTEQRQPLQASPPVNLASNWAVSSTPPAFTAAPIQPPSQVASAPVAASSERVPQPTPASITPVVAQPSPSSSPSPRAIAHLRSSVLQALDRGDDDEVTARLAELTAELGEDSPFVRRLSAFVLLRSGQWAEAERAYDALLTVQPNDAEARFNSGWLAMQRGDHDKARQRLRPLQRHPEFGTQAATWMAELDRHARQAGS